MTQKEKGITGEIIELKNRLIQPCTGCGGCFNSHRCVADDDFNNIYTKLIGADVVLIVSPHYAPIPAKLAALLEKMEQITYLRWGRDTSYQSEVFGTPTGVISHGGGGPQMQNNYKGMVNDTIADALEIIQMKLIPYNSEWDTGIIIPVQKAAFHEDGIFPIQEYDWNSVSNTISEYMDKIIMALREM